MLFPLFEHSARACAPERAHGLASAQVGEMGHFHPSKLPLKPERVQAMREVYMGGGYCLVPMWRSASPCSISVLHARALCSKRGNNTWAGNTSLSLPRWWLRWKVRCRKRTERLSPKSWPQSALLRMVISTIRGSWRLVASKEKPLWSHNLGKIVSDQAWSFVRPSHC